MEMKCICGTKFKFTEKDLVNKKIKEELVSYDDTRVVIKTTKKLFSKNEDMEYTEQFGVFEYIQTWSSVVCPACGRYKPLKKISENKGKFIDWTDKDYYYESDDYGFRK